jgi:hypothetical protein
MGLLRALFWFALFIFFTFCFVVLFNHGTADFANGFKEDATHAKVYLIEKFGKQPEKKKK